MFIKLKEENGVTICYVSGEINIDTVSELEKAFKKLIDEKQRKVLLNFDKLSYIDSLGIATLIEFTRKLKEIEGIAFLSNIPPKIRSIFGITKLDEVFKVYEEEGEALRAFGTD